MKKILLTAAESSLRSSSYVSPEAKVSEMHSEGVLCMSGEGSFNDLDDSNYVNW